MQYQAGEKRRRAGNHHAYLVTKAHGGEISVCSNAGEGTTVTVTLPSE
ncbi:MAG: hypothetical protein ACYC9O_19545 [Candidatus Latescibacterota bacterium]